MPGGFNFLLLNLSNGLHSLLPLSFPWFWPYLGYDLVKMLHQEVGIFIVEIIILRQKTYPD
jgi:hypothetical protein